jgi:hypothetical protein
MASALLYSRLLQRQILFTRHTQSRNIIICDNQGLLIRIEESSGWNYTTPNITLRPEWDTESVILATLKELGMQFKFMHVKSHQHDEALVTTLSLETRLTIKADRLATEYMKEDTERRPKVALFPSAKGQLKINNTTRNAQTPAGYLIHSRQRSDLGTMDKTDTRRRGAHGASHSYHEPQQCYLIKLCRWERLYTKETANIHLSI